MGTGQDKASGKSIFDPIYFYNLPARSRFGEGRRVPLTMLVPQQDTSRRLSVRLYSFQAQRINAGVLANVEV